jgi:hypothetical protein
MGTLCRMLYCTSLAFETRNRIGLELATPGLPSTTDTAVAVCLSDPSYNLTSSSFRIWPVLIGGNQFDGSDDGSESGDISPRVSFSSLHQILEHDPFYTSSFRTLRCEPLPLCAQ